MKDVELKILKDDVKDICYQNIEEVFLMAKYCLIAYVKSVMSFGRDHFVTLEVIRVWKEFLSIIREEKNILKYLVQYGFFEDMEEVNNFMFELKDVNEETVLYYYEVLDGIETACEMNLEWRATRPKKEFATLIETEDYRRKLCFLTISLEDIKKFLGYEEEFWEYIQKRILFIDSHFEEDRDFYGVNIKLDDNQCLKDIKVFVPNIINLSTALVNVHEFNHAYCLYKRLGYSICESDDFYEEVAKNCEKMFEEDYLVKKYKRDFARR